MRRHCKFCAITRVTSSSVVLGSLTLRHEAKEREREREHEDSIGRRRYKRYQSNEQFRSALKEVKLVDKQRRGPDLTCWWNFPSVSALVQAFTKAPDDAAFRQVERIFQREEHWEPAEHSHLAA